MTGGVPSDDELAAIAVALALTAPGAAPADVSARPSSAWLMAMRRPDLEFDELLVLRSACSTRF